MFNDVGVIPEIRRPDREDPEHAAEESVRPTVGGAAPCPPDHPGVALDADAAAARRGVLDLAAAAHRAGMATDRLEALLGAVGRALGVPATFFATPTAVMASFQAGLPGIGESPVPSLRSAPGLMDGTIVLRADAGEVDLGRLAALEVLAGEVLDAAVRDGVAAAIGRLREGLGAIAAARPVYTRAGEVLAFAGASAVVSVLFGSNSLEVLAAGVLALVVWLVLQAAAARPRLGGMALPLASLLAAAGAPAAAFLTGGDAFRLALSAVIVLVPGLSLTLAMREVAARHLVSGSARVMGALVDFLGIAFGIGLGLSIGEGLLGRLGLAAVESWGHGAPLPAWAVWAALAVAPLNLAVLFRAPPSSVVFAAAASTLGFVVADAGSALHPALSAMLAATAVGAAGNLVAHRTSLPPSVVVVPGIMLLVPGSLGMQATAALLADDASTGLATAAAAILAAGGLATGLLVANAAVPPPLRPRPRRRSRRTGDRRATTPASAGDAVAGVAGAAGGGGFAEVARIIERAAPAPVNAAADALSAAARRCS